jgi:chromosome segregation ATPase
MTLENLERLEKRITTLTEKFAELKKSHEKALGDLSVRDKRIDELNEKMKDFQKTKVQIHSKIENILKRLEGLKAQSEE